MDADLIDYDDTGDCVCPHCGGIGTVNCYCGGDQCYCENYVETECRICDGEGCVSDETFDRYQQRAAENAAKMKAIWDAATLSADPNRD